MRKIILLLSTIVIIGVVILVYLLMGTNQTEEINVPPVVNETIIPECVVGWECIDDSQKAYKNLDCSYSENTTCELGCVLGNCTEAEKCTVGFVCLNETHYGYQTESCNFTNVKNCTSGCFNDVCNETVVEEVSEILVESISLGQEDILKFKEIKIVEKNSTQYNLSLHNMDFGQVIIKVNDDKSDWLPSNSNYTYRQIMIQIEDISYQNYFGGIQEMTYKVT